MTAATVAPRPGSTTSSRLLRLRTFFDPDIGGGRKFFGIVGDELDRIGRAASVFAVDGQSHGNPRSLAQPAADIDITVVQTHQALHDGKSEARAVVTAIVRRARLEERF